MGEKKEKGRLSTVAVQEEQCQWWAAPDEHLPLGFFSGAAGGNNEDDNTDNFFFFFLHPSPLTLYTQDHVKIPTGCFNS